MTSFNEAFYEEFLEVADTLDSYERLDGQFDVVELMYDGTTRMVTKSYDPLGQYPDVSDPHDGHTSIEDVDPMADIPF